jgi:sporulation protein YlmC with PRC-barrel domain
MEEADHRADNPYTAIVGYELQDASGVKVGKVEETVYDAPSDVLKYIIANKHAILADRIEVDAENESVRVPYGREVIESAPVPEDPSGKFDRMLRAHYGEPGG